MLKIYKTAADEVFSGGWQEKTNVRKVQLVCKINHRLKLFYLGYMKKKIGGGGKI